MKGPDPKTSAGLSDLEAAISVTENGEVMAGEQAAQQDFREPATQARTLANLRLLWESRRFLGCVAGAGLLLSTLIAFLIPNRYESVARLMPPDSNTALAQAAVALAGGAAGLGGIASELLGQNNSSDLLAGILSSRTVADTLIQKFDLRKVYGAQRTEDARKGLAARTKISVDRSNQIITISVTDNSPQRAAAMAQAYLEELNRTVAEVSTTSARRERIFLEGCLQAVNQDLEVAEKEFSQFSSKNTAIGIKEQGKSLEKATQSDSLYPSIGKLPLLGVTYADLYRKTKIDETVFETLGQEYELARVEEAKGIATVKVLDPPNLPEKKSFPPRLSYMLLGTVLALSCGLAWVFGRTRWEQTDPSNPGKVLAQEVFDSVKAAMPWASRSGS